MSCPDLSSMWATLCGEANPPGISEIYAIEHEYVETIPAATDHVISTDYTLTATKFWRKMPFTPGSGKYTKAIQGETNHFSWDVLVEFQVAKDRSAVSTAIDKMVDRPLLILVKNANGDVIQFGDADHPVYLQQANYDSGAGGTDKATRTMQFKAIPPMAKEPYFYTGAIATS